MTGTDQTAAFALLDNTTASVTYADTVSDLVDLLVDGHGDLPEGTDDGADARLALRADALANLAAQSQSTVLAALGTESLDEDALTILMHDRRLETAAFAEWDSTLPLFLLSTSYAPFTETAKPIGDAIIWLNPATERSFLDSLTQIGVAELFVRDPESLS